ncbi:MAG TPA: methyltransferase domain-containing protein [Solirubrobacterales bacterium]|nr:methyltransferase domain-containing protein [Solirubrobacterales bacterium]
MSDASEVDAKRFNAFEAEGWEASAVGYHDFFEPITTRAIEPLMDAVGVADGDRVLDVATGPGYVAAAAAARGAQVTGIDISAKMVALAGARHPGIRFLRGDAEALPFEPHSFDAVVASFAILHLGRPEVATAEFARVLAPGGRVGVTVWDVPSRARLVGLLVDAVPAAGAEPPSDVPVGPDFFRFADDRELAELLVGVGLGEVEVRTISFNHGLADANELWEGLLAGTVRMRALIAGQSESVKRRIHAELKRLAAAHRSGDELQIPVSIKLGTASKP